MQRLDLEVEVEFNPVPLENRCGAHSTQLYLKKIWLLAEYLPCLNNSNQATCLLLLIANKREVLNSITISLASNIFWVMNGIGMWLTFSPTKV